jgi:hypothetical protein
MNVTRYEEVPAMHAQMTAAAKNLYREALHAKAKQLEMDADLLHYALLAPSMRERTLREEAKALRERAESAKS